MQTSTIERIPLTHGDIDMIGRVFRNDTGETAFTEIEHHLLQYFWTHRNQVITRKQLLQAVWGYQFPEKTRTDYAAILRLRKKIEVDAKEPIYLQTVYGVGYRFVWADSEDTANDAPPDDWPPSELPFTLGRYTLLEVIGRGGFATVYRAEFSGALGFIKSVALKVAHEPQNEAWNASFIQEARLGGLLRHPNSINVLDLGEFHGRPYICMDFIDGETLQEVLDAHERLPPPISIYIALALCDALESAHNLCVDGERVGLTHRDLKPSNIMLGQHGTVTLLDFGIARMGRPFHDQNALMLSAGTPGYMSPEQWLNAPVDHRTDIFALGLILYEMILGQRLLSKDTDRIRETLQVEALFTTNNGAERINAKAAGLGDLVRQCLQRNPENRVPTMGHLAEELRRIALHWPRVEDPRYWLTQRYRRLSTGEDTDVFGEPPFPHSGHDLPKLNVNMSIETNIGPDQTAFIGRTTLLTQVYDALKPARARIGLNGFAGIGKTRVAQELARQFLANGVVQGVWFCSIHGNATEKDVYRALGNAFRLDVSPEHTERALRKTVGDSLIAQGSSLIIFDEHSGLSPALEGIIQELAEGYADIRVLLTSREAAEWSALQWFDVNPMDVPELDADAAALEANESALLFQEHARKKVPHFSLAQEDPADIVRLLHRLEGIPLTIELVAPNMRFGTISQLLQRMDRDASGSRVNQYQSTYEPLLAQSWEMLDPWAQSVLCQLGQFEPDGSWAAIEAIVDVSEYPDAPWVVDIVDELIRHSLVHVREGNYGVRIRLLEPVRRFIQRRVSERSPAFLEACTRRFVAHYTAFGHTFDANGNRLAQRFQEARNIVAATRDAMTYGWMKFAIHGFDAMAGNLFRFMGRDASLPFCKELESAFNETAPVFALRVRLERASMHQMMSEPEQSENLFHEVLQMARDLGAPRIEGRALAGIGRSHIESGDVERSLSFFKEAIQLGEQHHIHSLTVRPLLAWSMAEAELLHFGQAIELAAEAVEKSNHAMGLFAALHMLGDAYLNPGHLNESEDAYTRALRHAQTFNLKRGILVAQLDLVRVMLARGARKKALARIQEAVRFGLRTGNMKLLLYARNIEAEVYMHLRHFDQAVITARDLSEMTQKATYRSRFFSQLLLAEALMFHGQSEASRLVTQTLDQTSPQRTPAMQLRRDIVQSGQLSAQGDHAAATRQMAAVQETIDRLGIRPESMIRQKFASVQSLIHAEGGRQDGRTVEF